MICPKVALNLIFSTFLLKTKCYVNGPMSIKIRLSGYSVGRNTKVHGVCQVIKYLGFNVHSDIGNAPRYGRSLVAQPRTMPYRYYVTCPVCTDKYCTGKIEVSKPKALVYIKQLQNTYGVEGSNPKKMTSTLPMN